MRLGPNFLILLSLGLSLLLAALDQTVVAAAMPVISSELSNGIGSYAWITVSYLAMSAIALPFGGLFCDRWGRKKTMIAGLVGFAVSSIWCAIQFVCASGIGAGSAWLTPMNEFIAARLLQGACAGVILSSVFIIIADLYTPAQRGRYQGLFAAIWALASLAGPYAGGWLTQHEGWRWIFFINLPIALMALAILLPAAVFEIDDAWRHPYSKKDIVSLFSNSTIVISIVSVFVSGMGMYGGTALIPLIFHVTMGAGPEAAGKMLTPLVVTTCFFSVIAGLYLSKFKRYKKLVVVGVGLMGVGTLAMPTQSLFLVAALIAGAGLGLLLPTYTIIIQSIVPEEILGISTGISQFTRCVGGAIGTYSMGLVLSCMPFAKACESIFEFYGVLLVLTMFLNMALQEVPLSGRQRHNAGVTMSDEAATEVSAV
jgi:MFS family permease